MRGAPDHHPSMPLVRRAALLSSRASPPNAKRRCRPGAVRRTNGKCACILVRRAAPDRRVSTSGPEARSLWTSTLQERSFRLPSVGGTPVRRPSHRLPGNAELALLKRRAPAQHCLLRGVPACRTDVTSIASLPRHPVRQSPGQSPLVNSRSIRRSAPRFTSRSCRSTVS